jgi:hypothetical protein
MIDTGHWVLTESLEFNETFFGFIYEIYNKKTDKKYIGKKQMISKIRRKPLKGKKRARIDFKESDWKSYTGSSNDLNDDIKKYGKDNFTFTILKFCNSKWELAYFECKIQLEKDVLLREDYYNGIINVRIGTPPKSFNAIEL